MIPMYRVPVKPGALYPNETWATTNTDAMVCFKIPRTILNRNRARKGNRKFGQMRI